MDDRAWKTLLTRIKGKKCTPFVGAGAAAGVLPLGADVAIEWAKAEGYPLDDDDNLTRVAQYIAVTTGDWVIPKEMIAEKLEAVSPPDFSNPLEPHGLLADLQLPVYITTNYDDFMTQALVSRGKEPHREVCRWNQSTRDMDDLPSVFDDKTFKPTPEEPVVFHLHGIRETPESMVLTEDDYLDFVVNLTRYEEILPRPILGAFTHSSLLFVGYSLQDWTFKVLFKGLVGSLEGSARKLNLAVQLAPDEQPAEDYLDQYFKDQDVGVYWGEAKEFAEELRKRLDEQAESDG